MNTLVINAGSTSIKYGLYTNGEKAILTGVLKNNKNLFTSTLLKNQQQYNWEINKTVYNNPQDLILNEIKGFDFDNIAFRVVHGVDLANDKPLLVTKESLKVIKKYNKFAPLHNPFAIKIIQGFFDNKNINQEMFIVFDTTFFRDLKPEAFLYSLPYSFYKNLKIRKYGFHGNSHKYLSNSIKNLEPTAKKVITCHLGGGSSVSAIKNGKALDTSMGFTPLTGVTMSTRSGDFDPEIIIYLENIGYTKEVIEEILNKKSGLLGISEISADMEQLIKMAEKNNLMAKLAIKVFNYDVVQYIGKFIVSLEGFDALIFSGGIGENAPLIRQLICKKLKFLNVNIDDNINQSVISPKNAVKISLKNSVPVWVIPAKEELQIARDIYEYFNIQP